MSASIQVNVVGAANLNLKGSSREVWAIVGLNGELLGRTEGSSDCEKKHDTETLTSQLPFFSFFLFFFFFFLFFSFVSLSQLSESKVEQVVLVDSRVSIGGGAENERRKKEGQAENKRAGFCECVDQEQRV
jgi:hypothetical protein